MRGNAGGNAENARERRERAGTLKLYSGGEGGEKGFGGSILRLVFLLAVLREASRIAKSSWPSFNRSVTFCGEIIRVSMSSSIQKLDSSISSKAMLSLWINSARDLER